MTTFVFKDPSGKTHEVTGPEGATQEQAFAMLQQSMGGAVPAAPKPEPTSKVDRFLTGVMDPIVGAAQIADEYLVDPIRQKISPGASSMKDVTKARDAEYVAPEGVDWMRLGGNVANPVNWAGGGSVGLSSKIPLLAKATAALPTATNIARSAAGGVVGGALQPVGEGESRLDNMEAGGILGAVTPPAFKLLAKAGRGARNVGQRFAAGALPEGFGGGRAAAAVGERKVADILRKEVGETMPDVTYTRHPFIEGAPSAAVATQSPKLASLERASRMHAGDAWQGFDEAAQAARWKAIDEGLQTSDDVTRLLGKADEVGQEVPGVYSAVKPKAFKAQMDDFYSGIQQAKQSAQYLGNPAVRAAVDYVENTMREAGSVTPELLHTMRRTITKGLTGAPGAGEAGVRAAQSEPFIISLAQRMDDVLDTSSKGKWGSWKQDYAEAMHRAESAKADVNIRGKFVDEATGTVRKPATGVGGAPQVTPAALKQAIASAGSVKRGPRKGQNLLSTGSEDLLQGVVRDLDAQALLQRAKAASTGGSGSDTASNLAQAAMMEAMLPTGLGTARFVAGRSGAKTQEAMHRQLASLLQDPAALRRFLEVQQQQKLLRSGMPLLPGGGVGIGNLGAYGLSE